MKKRTIITTERREVWVIHHASEPIEQDKNVQSVVDILNVERWLPAEQNSVEAPATLEEVENEHTKDLSPKKNGTFEKIDPEDDA